MTHELKITVEGKAGTGRTSMAILLYHALEKAGVENIALESLDCEPRVFECITEMLENGKKDMWKSMVNVTIVDKQLPRTSND